jgi:DNA-binding PadR family transcriptional regulator
MLLFDSMVPRPLKPQAFQILLALASGPRHGSGIVRAVLEETGGAVRLWPVLLYSSLEQLADDHLIEEVPADERPEGESSRLKFYRLTRAGRRALADEADRLAALAQRAKAQLAIHRRRS